MTTNERTNNQILNKAKWSTTIGRTHDQILTNKLITKWTDKLTTRRTKTKLINPKMKYAMIEKLK